MYIDHTPFTRKEVLILKQLHKNLTRTELEDLTIETPENYSVVGKKFWMIMKLFGVEYDEAGPEGNVVASRYAKWALDNWTESGDYENIEKPIKVPLKWYNVEMDETGTQVEYKSGEAEVMGYDEDDAEERALYNFYELGWRNGDT